MVTINDRVLHYRNIIKNNDAVTRKEQTSIGMNVAIIYRSTVNNGREYVKIEEYGEIITVCSYPDSFIEVIDNEIVKLVEVRNNSKHIAPPKNKRKRISNKKIKY